MSGYGLPRLSHVLDEARGQPTTPTPPTPHKSGDDRSPSFASSATPTLPHHQQPPPPPHSQQPQHQHQQQQAQQQQHHQSETQQAQSQDPNQSGHKRVYQACIPCRRRKVRCDLGSVDNPHDPPCVRCRRESKECYFSATRRKRKTEDDPAETDYIVRNGRRRLHSDGHGDGYADDFDEPVIAPGVRSHPLRRPQPDDPNARSRSASRRAGSLNAEESSIALENLEAQSVMRREVYGPHDALDLLYKAATDGPHTKVEDTAANSTPAGQASTSYAGATSSHRTDFYGPAGSGTYGSGRSGARSTARSNGAQPANPYLSRPDPAEQPGYDEALKLWARFRFVRAGWFTAQEAIEYIDYYYKYLSPLTPISPPTFNNPASHVTLLNEEPILAVTLLTISSRYKTLSGPGATCRSHAIHEQLWTYLRGMIERVVWGQEAFGGGFCGSGADSSTAPWRGLRKGSLRTLGTIESLMILTEWHPRALHFPPADVTDELLLSSDQDNPSNADDGGARPAGGVGGKRIDSWLEPAWRSDRMCWMLLSTAMGVAYELGVFDDIDEMLTSDITRPEYEEETYRLRAYRIKRLLLIYLTQLAGRLGWTSMVSESMRKKDPAAARKRPNSSVDGGQTPGTNPSSASNAFNYIPDLELDDQIIHCWAGISDAMHTGNEKLFRSRQHTTDIIQSGKYTELLKDFQPILRDWLKEFERFKLPPFIRHILSIEYEYVRIYINSLSLQAVVERCTTNAGNSAAHVSGPGGIPMQQLSPQTQNYYGKLPLGRLGGVTAVDQAYVKEVVDGSRNLLKTVVDGLLPGGYLKHAPVRTYFRIISGAMFLLKTFALGAPKADVQISIALMDRTVSALRNCVVDDVHLGTRFADLLESLTSRLRNRFIHAPPPPADSLSAANSGVGVGGGGGGNGPVSADACNSSHPGGGGSSSSSSSSSNTAVNGEGADARTNSHSMRHDSAGMAPSAGVAMGAGGGDTTGGGWSRSGLGPANISATPFDSTAGNFPFGLGAAPAISMPTPAAMHGLDAGDMADAGLVDATDWNNNEMWYLPAGPAFFQNMGDSNVAMTAEGVSVAGLDLLDFMAMDGPTYQS